MLAPTVLHRTTQHPNTTSCLKTTTSRETSVFPLQSSGQVEGAREARRFAGGANTPAAEREPRDGAVPPPGSAEPGAPRGAVRGPERAAGEPPPREAAKVPPLPYRSSTAL